MAKCTGRSAKALGHAAAIDAWLRGPVAAAYDEIEESTAHLMTPEEVRASLRGRIDESTTRHVDTPTS